MPLEPDSSARDEQLAALLASAPPRIVPAALLRAANRQRTAGPLGLVGFIFTLMGLFLVALFSPWNMSQDWRLAAATTALAPGRVIAADRTGMSINKQRVILYEFAFLPGPGVRMRGESYTTGVRWKSGDDVTVRFSVSNPEFCCIEGARLSEGGAVGLIVFLFPAVGIGLLLGVMVARRRLRWLLENGVVAEALVKGVDQTPMRINRQQVYKITLQRTNAGGGAAIVLRTDQPAQVEFARQRLETRQPVFVLYDPAHPRRALLPEAL